MQRLLLTSYDGTIRTLEFSEGRPPRDALKVISSTTAASPNPSWITLDTGKKILYCNSNDASTGGGSLKSFSVHDDGSLQELCSIPAPLGAAYHTLCNNQEALVIPYYYSGCVGVYNVKDATRIEEVQIITFPDFVPGSGRSQEQPRPHQTVVDPTGRYLLVPDLGADRIRVFSISQDPASLHQMTELQGLQLKHPSFPRHVMFAVLGDRTMMYILNQDICTLLSYKAEYLPGNGGLSFHQEGEEIDLLDRKTRIVKRPEIKPPEHGTTASHLAISPDKNFLVLSVRKDRAFEIKSPLDPDATITADSILSYRIDQKTGALSFAHESHSGGQIPRQFCLNRAGDRIAIGQQTNGWLSIYERDLQTGEIGKLLAIKDGLGENGPACVKWFSPEQAWS